MTKEKDPNKICPPILTTNSCDYDVSTPINSVQDCQRLHVPSIGRHERNATTTIFKTPCKSLKKKKARKTGRRERGKRGKGRSHMVVRVQIFLNSSTSVSPVEMLPAYICALLKNTIKLYHKVRHANSPTESHITLLLMNNVVQKKSIYPKRKES